MKLLIVDDIAANRRLLRAQLEAEGLGVLEACNGTEALFLLAQKSVDGVISDILMPSMDGFRLCQEIRRDPKLFALPLVLYTSTYDSPSDRSLADSVGADFYLLKPAPVAEILAAIAAAREGAARRSLTPPAEASGQEMDILKEYNAALVRKLEDRNAALQELNRTLESRVAERTAALHAANQELEAFASSVSHDLRAPLRHIGGYADLLQESLGAGLQEGERSMLERILSSVKKMDALIFALLEFSRTGRVDLACGPVELDAVVHEALELIGADLKGRKIEWRRSPLPRVRGDAALLRQVFVNLLSNAVKYTRPRKLAKIEIGHRPEGDAVTLFVRDNGVGFDMRHAKNLFGVFRRLHRENEFEGTGIGLANAHRIVTRHGGRMWVEAEVDRGATFYFTLPQENTGIVLGSGIEQPTQGL